VTPQSDLIRAAAAMTFSPVPCLYSREDLKGPAMVEAWRQMEEHGEVREPNRVFCAANVEATRLTRSEMKHVRVIRRMEHFPTWTEFPDLDLRLFVARLPEAVRTLLTLHYVDGWTAEEIGREWGVTEAQVRWRLDGAKRLARIAWEGKGPAGTETLRSAVEREIEARGIDLSASVTVATQAEIAAACGCTRATVKKALALLRQDAGVRAPRGRTRKDVR
jgi:DNA-directed RNA polymerase specialized sigma24 family protein